MSEDPGYIADRVSPGDSITVILPDGTSHDAVVLREYPGGSVAIDFVDRVAELRRRQASPNPRD